MDIILAPVPSGYQKNVRWALDLEDVKYFTPDFENTCEVTEGKANATLTMLKKLPPWLKTKARAFKTNHLCPICNGNFRCRLQDKIEILSGTWSGHFFEVHAEDLVGKHEKESFK